LFFGFRGVFCGPPTFLLIARTTFVFVFGSLSVRPLYFCCPSPLLSVFPGSFSFFFLQVFERFFGCPCREFFFFRLAPQQKLFFVRVRGLCQIPFLMCVCFPKIIVAILYAGRIRPAFFSRGLSKLPFHSRRPPATSRFSWYWLFDRLFPPRYARCAPRPPGQGSFLSPFFKF